MRVLMLYRPRLPGQRAQALQTVHMADALARAGHTVTLLADRGDEPGTPAAALARFGLSPCLSLDLRIAPVRQRGLAGLWFRRELSRWWSGPPGVVYARDLRRLVDAFGVVDALESFGRAPLRHRVVVEVHGQGAQAGEDLVGDGVLDIESAALRCADALVANCEGTASAWRAAHGVSAIVAHNATAPHRRRGPTPSDGVVRVVGSLRSYKGWGTVWAAAKTMELAVELIGGQVGELSGHPPPGVTVLPAVPHHEVPDLLARSAVLLLPLADNRFGRELTSPLKLWDYLATATPLVLPDLPSIHRALACVGTTADAHFYTAGEPRSLRAAVLSAAQSPRRGPVVRSWDDRIADLKGLFTGILSEEAAPNGP